MTNNPSVGWWGAPGRWKAEATPWWDDQGFRAADRAAAIDRFVQRHGDQLSLATRAALRGWATSARVDAFGFYAAGAAAQLAPDTWAGVAFDVATLGRARLISAAVLRIVKAARAAGFARVVPSDVYRQLNALARNPLMRQTRAATRQIANEVRELERMHGREMRPPPPPPAQEPITSPLVEPPPPRFGVDAPTATRTGTLGMVRARRRQFDWSRNVIPPPQLQQTVRADRPGTPGWGMVVERTRQFDWAGQDIPPPQLQGTVRPDRPGQPGWGMKVTYSQPFHMATTSERLAWLSHPEGPTIAMLDSWADKLAKQQEIDHWVDQTHQQWLQERYQHDPLRLADEQLRWSRSQPPFDASSSTLAALDRIADQAQAARETQQFLNRISAQYGR